MQPNVRLSCESENGVKCFVNPFATFQRVNSFIKHLTQDDDLFISCPAPSPSLCSVYLQSASELMLLFLLARQTILPGLLQVSAFLLSVYFSFIMRQRRGYNAPHWLEKLTDKWTRQRAEGRATQGLNISFNLLPEAMLVQIPVISPAAVEFYLHLLLIIHHKLYQVEKPCNDPNYYKSVFFIFFYFILWELLDVATLHGLIIQQYNKTNKSSAVCWPQKRSDQATYVKTPVWMDYGYTKVK